MRNMDTYWKNVLQRLFPSQSSKRNIPILEEELKRSSQFEQAYFHWLNSGAYRSFLSLVYEAYQLKAKGKPHPAADVHLLQMPAAQGIAVSYQPIWSAEKFTCFFDYLKQATLDVNYTLYTSSRRVFDRGKYLECIERHYLKPPVSRTVGATEVNQLYGNILIEQVYIDEKPSFLRLTANTYAGRPYTPPLPFPDFLRQVLLG